ncbi:MAG: hypothetical protein ABR985_06205 [Methanotrichaceae archaeon]
MTEADPWRRYLVPQPRRKGDLRVLLENLRVSIAEFEASLPPDEPEPEDPDEESDSPELKRYKRRVNKLRKDLRSLRKR